MRWWTPQPFGFGAYKWIGDANQFVIFIWLRRKWSCHTIISACLLHFTARVMSHKLSIHSADFKRMKKMLFEIDWHQLIRQAIQQENVRLSRNYWWQWLAALSLKSRTTLPRHGYASNVLVRSSAMCINVLLSQQANEHPRPEASALVFYSISFQSYLT